MLSPGPWRCLSAPHAPTGCILNCGDASVSLPRPPAFAEDLSKRPRSSAADADPSPNRRRVLRPRSVWRPLAVHAAFPPTLAVQKPSADKLWTPKPKLQQQLWTVVTFDPSCLCSAPPDITIRESSVMFCSLPPGGSRSFRDCSYNP